MSDGARNHRLLLAGAVILLLGSAAIAMPVSAEGAAAPTTDQEAAEAGGSCCGCCGQTAEVAEAGDCGRAGQAGCCGAMRGPRQGAAHRGAGYGRGAGQGYGAGHGGGMGMGCRIRRGAGHAGGARGGGPAMMPTIHSLVHDYREQIERTVEEVENGVVTVTRAPESAEAAEAILRHVREAKQLVESGGHIRMWDPLFRELLGHADAITMDVEELEDGVRVTETSDDPEVARLIQAHARKVSEFIERGPAAVHEETPLPEGYAPAG